MKIAIAFLCKYPTMETISFAERLSKTTTFDIFIVSDQRYNGRQKTAFYPNMEVICIDDHQCVEKGYINANIGTKDTHIPKNPIAWDKMLYIFCEKEPQYDFLWVFEDDVFIPSVETLLNLHVKYGESFDLVTPNHFAKTDKLKDWHWKHIFQNCDPPYFYSMVCACGISRNLFKVIKEWVRIKRKLFHIEAMFNTLAVQNNLRVTDAFELKSVVWQGNWGLDEFLQLPNNVFHPVKLQFNYEMYRAKIEKSRSERYIPQNKLPDFIAKLMT